MRVVEIGVSFAVVIERRALAVGVIVEMERVPAARHVRQLRAVVVEQRRLVGYGFVAQRFRRAKAVGIVFEFQLRRCVRHRRKLTAVLPCVRPRSVAQHIADGIARNLLPVVTRQQIRPVFVCVAVCDRIKRRDPFKASRRVGIFAFLRNIPARVVSISPRLSRRRIVFPRQLVQTVVDIRRGVRSVANAQDIPVRVVGISIRLVVRRADGIGQRPYLRGSMRVVRVRVAVGRHDHGDRLVAVLGRMVQIVRPQAAVGVVAVFARDAAVT